MIWPRAARTRLAVVTVCLAALQELNVRACTPQQLYFVSPPTWISFEECIDEKQNTMDLGHVGANRAVIAKCWCSTKVSQVVADYGCNDHPNFKHLSSINCEDTCDSEKAKKCLDECPPLCLEADFAPDSCDCESNGCLEHTLCIVEKGKRDTMAGDLERVCHEKELDESPQILGYFQCMHIAELRTPWHRRNSQSYCECTSGMGVALESADCCGSAWASPVCKQACQSSEDCGTEEAQKCLTKCAEVCLNIQDAKVSEACAATCMNDGAECAKWRTCRPAPRQEFPYVCGDGTAPMKNGCCKFPIHNGLMYQLACPKLCDLRQTYRIKASAQDVWQHSVECQCGGCPDTVEEAVFKWNQTVKDSFWDNGQNVLRDIARAEGLELGATQEMQVLMKLRNDNIKAAILKHDSPYDDKLEATIEKINEASQQEITKAAKLRRQCDLNPTSSMCFQAPTKAPTTASAAIPPAVPKEMPGENAEDDDEEDSSSMLMIGIASGAIVVCGLAVCAGLLLRHSKAKPAANTEATAQEPLPLDGDSNVVIGRPVPGRAAAASTGAPVQMVAGDDAQKGKSDSSAGKDNNAAPNDVEMM